MVTCLFASLSNRYPFIGRTPTCQLPHPLTFSPKFFVCVFLVLIISRGLSLLVLLFCLSVYVRSILPCCGVLWSHLFFVHYVYGLFVIDRVPGWIFLWFFVCCTVFRCDSLALWYKITAVGCHYVLICLLLLPNRNLSAEIGLLYNYSPFSIRILKCAIGIEPKQTCWFCLSWNNVFFYMLMIETRVQPPNVLPRFLDNSPLVTG